MNPFIFSVEFHMDGEDVAAFGECVKGDMDFFWGEN